MYLFCSASDPDNQDMDIYLGELVDLNSCLRIDDSFETEYVWQMEENSRGGNISVGFRLTRLPRPMKVMHVITDDQLVQDFTNGGALFVAYDENVVGFISMRRVESNQSAHISSIVVAPKYRRQGVGTRLVKTALDWTRQQRLRMTMLDISTKNFPGISFFQKQGFHFCGFNDEHYANKDIALFFSARAK